eukprot:116185_1
MQASQQYQPVEQQYDSDECKDQTVTKTKQRKHIIVRDKQPYQLNLVIASINSVLFLIILIALVVSIISFRQLYNNIASNNTDDSTYTNNPLVITFTICNVPSNELTDEAIQASIIVYKNNFASLFGVSGSAVTASVEIGDFCSFRRRSRRRLQSSSDKEVTVSTQFPNSNDAAEAQIDACEAIEGTTEFDNCVAEIQTTLTPLQQCMADSCSYNALELVNRSSLRIDTLPNQILPGCQFLSYSFNLLQGLPPTDLILEGLYRQVIDFTFDNEQISSGTNNYLVPDQIDLPSITGVCSQESSTSSVSSSMSTASMSREASESTGSKSFSASVEASGWGFSMSASTAMASTYSNSRSSSASRNQARSGRTESTYTYSKALLYSTQLQWDVISSYKTTVKQAIQNLETAVSSNVDQLGISFLGDFGTHVLDLARMGARCRQTTYFVSSMSSEAYSYSSQQSSSSASSSSGSLDAGGGGFGFSLSVSAAFSESSSQGNSEANSGFFEASSTTESSSEYIDCTGEVSITSMCGGMLGTQNQPALVGYRMKKIWELPIFDDYPIAKQNIEATIAKINNSAIECGKLHCGGMGVCAIKRSFWTLFEYKNLDSNYSKLFDPYVCLNQYQIGSSMMKSGHNIQTQMSQCKSNDVVVWGARHEQTTIRFEPLSETGVQIAIGLSLVNHSNKFAAEINKIQSDSFGIKYALYDYGEPYACTSIGGVSYAIFGENTIVRTKIVAPYGRLAQAGMNYEMLPALECLEGQDREAIAVLTSIITPRSYNFGITSITSLSSTTVQVQSINEGTILDERFPHISEICLIHFCYDKSALRFGIEEITGNLLNSNKKSLRSSLMYRKWIKYDGGALPCLTVNIFAAFSYLDRTIGILDNSCSLSIWTEGRSGAGFNLVLGVWSNDMVKEDGSLTRHPAYECFNDDNKIKISWLAICQNL